MKLMRFLKFLLISGRILMPTAFKAVISGNKKRKAPGKEPFGLRL